MNFPANILQPVPGTAALLDAVRRHGEDGHRWTADLRVDRTDPFFFDHPLDHVPGMLLLCGALDLARAGAAGSAAHRLRTALTFRRICELAPDPALELVDRDGRYDVHVRQGAAVAADGWFAFDSTGTVAVPPAAPARPLPAEALLVHRVRTENVMIGDPHRTDDGFRAPVLVPSAEHALAGRGPDTHSVECLIEAARQFITLLVHRIGRWPLGAQIIWLGVVADLPTDLPRTAGLALRWRTAPLGTGRTWCDFDLVGVDDPAPVLGTLRYHIKVLSAQAYGRFRRASGGTA
ncbi:AfsA-related hotdog domain-containing protein [Actinoplanes sp. NPDC049681]|uniref:AfsA-related hotdog domain-containing protein n=1 Tax=Actinoplanes sp. NPDC049681 TaxID=3363905 RepID=UPI00379AA90E